MGEKQYVVSARVSEGGLHRLNELKREVGKGWDGLLLEAVSAHYGIDIAELALPKPEGKAEGSEVGKTRKGEG